MAQAHTAVAQGQPAISPSWNMSVRRLMAAAVCLALVVMLAPVASVQEQPEKGDAPSERESVPPPADDPAEGASGQRDASQEEPTGHDFDELAAITRRDGRVRAIVGLPVDFTPEGGCIPGGVRRRRRHPSATDGGGLQR